ncbi:MAG: polysaccharide deacetylase family protein, partial [Mangrovimonas sp.]|nr:polysaccharide deacetylase family protein [Mangrovimonas sp.]
VELQRTNGIITQLVKKSPLLYRPIYGVTNPAIKRAVKQLNLKSIGWNVRSLDTVLNENQAYNRLLKIKKGDLILLHDTSQKTVNILERLLRSLSEQNLSSVTVDELLNIEAYE